MDVSTHKNMKCKLCGEDAELRYSHIFPEFVYKPLYDDKHRFHVLSDSHETPPKREQKGIREHLLCAKCETLFAKYERYASLVFDNRANVRSRREGDLVRLEGIEYKSFKLFALSVLWRAGVSSLPLFSQVTLGPHEKKLRTMLRDEDAGPPEKYPFLMASVVHDEKSQSDLIIQPTWARVGGHKAYRFIFSGIAWTFVVSNHTLPGFVRYAALSDNDCATLLVSEVKDMPFLRDFIASVFKAGNIPK